MVLAAALLVFGGACGSDDGETEPFELTGRVVSVEPAAQPADVPEDADIFGAIVVQTAAPEECETDDDGVRVYLSEKTSVTPSAASDDLDALRGKTVSVSGGVTKDGDACTAIADRVTATAAKSGPTGTDEDTGDGADGGPTGSGATPSATDGADATSSPNDPDDEGYISDTEETASPAPEDPDEEGVVPQP